MTSLIRKILLKRFEGHRIVCWRDEKGEFALEYMALGLPEEIVVHKVDHDEFAVQYRVLREEKDRKFLLYLPGAEPPLEDNWLLNLEETYGRFTAERATLLAEEAGLGTMGANLVRAHEKFFASSVRLSELKKRLTDNASFETIRLQMMSVIAKCDATLESVLHVLIQEAADERDEKMSLLNASSLTNDFWQMCAKRFDYRSSEPSVRDFVAVLFRYAYRVAWGEEAKLDENARLNNDAIIFLTQWKDRASGQEAFRFWSEQIAKDFLIEEDLRLRDVADVPSVDYFIDIDEYVVHDLCFGLHGKTRSPMETLKLLRSHMPTFWDEMKPAYAALEASALFLESVQKAEYGIASAKDGFSRYQQVYWETDFQYRRFVYEMHETEAKSTEPVKEAMRFLKETIDKIYANEFLAKLAQAWQGVMDRVSVWPLEGVPSQAAFYRENVRDVIAGGKKLFVIISDALRYEVAKELTARLMQEDRFTADISAMCGVLPSYTALGMAALLPHASLALTDAGEVLADGKSTLGTEARKKVLQSASERATVVTAEDVLKNMSVGDIKGLCRDNNVVYLYHNAIDEVGDKLQSEGKVFEAVETAINELMLLVRKVTSGNVNNLIVTADHGFLYQDVPLTDDQYMSDIPEGKNLEKEKRRYVMGTGLRPRMGLQDFSATALGLEGSCEVQIAKGVNRLRGKGSGSRFVHGGASLQEIVVPLVRINKKRADDTHQVDVALLTTTSTINTNQHIVKFYQQEPVGGKTLSRTLRVGLYAPDGITPLSNLVDLVFDSDSEDVREREKMCTLILNSEADRHNNKHVMLRVESLQTGTVQYAPYQSQTLTLRRYTAFERDFD